MTGTSFRCRHGSHHAVDVLTAAIPSCLTAVGTLHGITHVAYFQLDGDGGLRGGVGADPSVVAAARSETCSNDAATLERQPLAQCTTIGLSVGSSCIRARSWTSS